MTTQNNAVSIPAAIDTDAVFTALEKWIGRRPRLELANYGCHPEQLRYSSREQQRDAVASYRQEVRDIGRDKKRAMKALDEARALDPQRPELLADAFKRAFSGRLEWVAQQVCTECGYRPGMDSKTGCFADRTEHAFESVTNYPGHLDYTTGQYFPTEYRKAAASVLETYIASWRQAYASEHPQTFTYQTIEDVKAANRQIGNHWFDRSTMRFFNTRIESGLIGGKYFITSERYDDSRPRLYTVRRADPDGTIDTVGEFQGYTLREDAREAIKGMMKEGK